MAFTRTWLLERSLAGTGDFAARWKLGLRHPLLDGKIVVFNQWLVPVGLQLVAKELLNESDLIVHVFDGDRLIWFGLSE